MANTFKFGNGNWAVKDGYALAYNDENNNFKPLPFDFTRASSATRVNKQGLIETVPSGKPRIDFTDNTDGHLLLEPSRTNSLLQSNQFDTTWALSSSIALTSGQSGVGGSTDAWLLKKTDASSRYIIQNITLISSTYSYSVFAKKESGNWLYVRLSDSGGSLASTSYFDLENGVVGSTSADSLSIHSYKNGWYRCEVKFTHSIGFVRMYPAVGDGSPSGGSGGEGIYIQNAQLEQGSATSYIPTEGSSVTRVVETTNATVPSGIFGTSGGTIYVEGVVAVEEGVGQMPFTAGTYTANLIYIWIQATGRLMAESYTSSLQCNISSSIGILSVGDSYKIAFGYANNDFVLYLNGTQIGTDTNGSIAVPSNVKVGGYIASGYEGGKIKQTKIYDTRLTNTELQNLTT